MSRFPLSLSERVKILLDYLISGESLMFEGRELIMVPRDKDIGAISQTFEYHDGERIQGPDTVIGVHMSLHRFLEMCLTLTYGDYDRMLHVMEDNKAHANH